MSLEDWSKKWQMEFNTSKCKVLHIGSSHQKFQYKINGQLL